MDKKIPDIDSYIADFPPTVQVLLEQMRATIKKAAPEAEEAMAYGIPTFKLNGNLVHFGGFKHHIGFYPAPMGLEAFKEELSAYTGAKGSVQFPLDQPLPLDLVTRIVEYRVQKVMEKAAGKTKKAEKP
ncbi:MAG: DUF1801 domain-containing protein [Saprospiraceae bacterium]